MAKVVYSLLIICIVPTGWNRGYRTGRLEFLFFSFTRNEHAQGTNIEQNGNGGGESDSDGGGCCEWREVAYVSARLEERRATIRLSLWLRLRHLMVKLGWHMPMFIVGAAQSP